MEGKAPAKDLRTIAALFQEHIHLIALKDSKINSVKDLKGKKYRYEWINKVPLNGSEKADDINFFISSHCNYVSWVYRLAMGNVKILSKQHKLFCISYANFWGFIRMANNGRYNKFTDLFITFFNMPRDISYKQKI